MKKTMTMSMIKLTVILSISVGNTSCWAFLPAYKSNHLNERWETGNGKFNIRVTAYAEGNGGFIAGAYFVFESSISDDKNWQQIFEFRHDDPIPIPRNQVRFIDEQTGYIFMSYIYAVTTDSGKTWSVWDIRRDLPRGDKRRAAIKEITLKLNGLGVMELKPFDGWQTQSPKLHTTDFGVHWAEQ